VQLPEGPLLPFALPLSEIREAFLVVALGLLQKVLFMAGEPLIFHFPSDLIRHRASLRRQD
jgi:hypothetical protein